MLIFVDELPYAEGLPRLLSDLNESGLPFTLIGTARQHEWTNSPLRLETARLAAWREFPLGRLNEDEARRLLERLEERQALGTLADKTPAQRLAYLLDRLQADGQLLPALLTARQGKAFESILEDVFTRLERRWGAEQTAFLLRGYAGIALVHRFGFWMSRPLLARFLEAPEAELTPRLLRPLTGELTEISEAEGRRLYTRHPWIAERSLSLLCGARLPEEDYLYTDLFHALRDYLLRGRPYAPERKLTTLLPLAFKYRGDFARARQLFARAAEADPKHAPALQAWALLEKEQGQIDRARQLFARRRGRPQKRPHPAGLGALEKEQGQIDRARQLFARAAEADPKHAPTLQAWALLEKEQGQIDRARQLFARAAEADPSDAPTLQAWALLEKEQGQIDRARQLFARAAEADPKHAPTLQAWALLEKEQGQIDRARQLFARAAEADPKHAPTLQAWALLEKEQGQIDRARQLFARAAEADPKHAPTLQAWALLEKEQGQIDRARQLFARAAEADPKHAPTLQAWARWKKNRAKLTAPASFFARRRGRPQTRPHPAGLGAAGKEQGQIDRFRQLFARRRGRPQTRPHPAGLGALEKEQGQIDRARQLFARRRGRPQTRPHPAGLGAAGKEQGQIDRARQLFARAAEADPKNAPTLQAWALLEAQQGNLSEAIRILEDGLQRVHDRRGRALLLSTLGSRLARQNDLLQAEKYFQQALELDERNPLTHYHFAVDVRAQGPPGRSLPAPAPRPGTAPAQGTRPSAHRAGAEKALQPVEQGSASSCYAWPPAAASA